MVETIFNLISIVVGLILTIIWIKSLVEYDGTKCDGYLRGECRTCPFPCDRRKP